MAQRKRKVDLSMYGSLIEAIVAAKGCTEKQAREILLTPANCRNIIEAAGESVERIPPKGKGKVKSGTE